MKKSVILILCSFPALFFISCAGSIMDYPELYREQVWGWENKLLTEPDNPDALKNLGIYYSQKKEHDQALLYIDRALKIDSKDPALNFYKGLKSRIS
jgi:tetratricopeptide (TPR) repeat protein